MSGLAGMKDTCGQRLVHETPVQSPGNLHRHKHADPGAHHSLLLVAEATRCSCSWCVTVSRSACCYRSTQCRIMRRLGVHQSTLAAAKAKLPALMRDMPPDELSSQPPQTPSALPCAVRTRTVCRSVWC